LDLCDRLVRIEPMLPRGHLLRAKILADPLAPKLMDLDAALASIAKARRLNRDETGGALEEGRVLILTGELDKAAAILEKVSTNPRAAALAALCWFRLGEPKRAQPLLVKKERAAPKGVTEEGDTADRRMDARDELARLLTLEPAAEWTLKASELKFPAEPVAASRATFQAARRFAMDPPERVESVPDISLVRCIADVDGDGDRDIVVASAGHALLPLPWWVFLKDGEGYIPVRGGVPHPGYRAARVASNGTTITIGSDDGEATYDVTWKR
jgi:hypothetical protein